MPVFSGQPRCTMFAACFPQTWDSRFPSLLGFSSTTDDRGPTTVLTATFRNTSPGAPPFPRTAREGGVPPAALIWGGAPTADQRLAISPVPQVCAYFVQTWDSPIPSPLGIFADDRRATTFSYSDFKNTSTCCCCAGVSSSRKFSITSRASPRCRLIASVTDSDFISCMNRVFVSSPHSGAVRSLLMVSAGPPCTIPSPVPTSCSRKSPYGWMTLFPSASGTTNVPPLTNVPAGAVTIDATWHVEQPI